MALTALEITQEAYSTLNLASPRTLLDSNDTVSIGAKKAINSVINNLLQNDWNFQRRDGVLTFPDTSTNDDIAGISMPLPTDYLRLVQGSVYNRSQQLQMQALSPSDWNKYRALKYSDNGLYYYLSGNLFYILPRNTLGNTFIFTYYSKYGVYPSGSTEAYPSLTRIASDDDKFPFDDELMILGTSALVAQTTGINDGSFIGSQYASRLDTLLSQDGSPKIYNMAKGQGAVFGISLRPYSSIVP